MSKKLVLSALIGLVTISTLMIVVLYNAKANDNPGNLDDRQNETRRIASFVDKGETASWTGEDNTRGTVIAAGQPVSDTDFRWAIQKLDLTNVDKGSQVGIVTMTISELLHANLSLSQVILLTKTALPLLSRNDPVYNDGDIQEYACKVFAKFPSNEAKPQLYSLVNSPHPWVRRDAARALAAMGESIEIPQRPKTW